MNSKVATCLGGFATAVCLATNASRADELWVPERLRLQKQDSQAGKVLKNLSESMDARIPDRRNAGRNDSVTTDNTRAWVILNEANPDVIMDVGTAIKLGKSCIELSQGGVLIVGKTCISIRGLSADVNPSISTNSSVVIERVAEGGFIVKTLAGQATIGKKPIVPNADYGLTSRYPKINPVISLNANPYTNVYPSSAGLLVGGVSAFVPLSQNRQKNILYSYTSLGSNLDGYWGASTELGYRKFVASSKSTYSTYLGFSGFESLGCMSYMLNLGGEWERKRWRLGGSAGLKAGGCNTGFNFGAINLSFPFAKLDQFRSGYISFTPYVLWGDGLISPFNYSGDGSSVSPGARITVSIPLSERLNVDAYGGVDAVYGAMTGARITYRIPLGRELVKDPNLSENRDIQAEPAPVVAYQQESEVLVKAAYKATFTDDGKLVGEVVKMSPKEFSDVALHYMEGFDPLPESNRIARVAAENGALTSNLAATLGVNFLSSASIPVSRSVQPPFDVTTVFPTAPYVCAVTGPAKAYAVERLLADGKIEAANRVAAANQVFVGRGSNTTNVTNGWNVTTSVSEAFRIANGSVCGDLNSIINGVSDYTGPRNPLETIVIN